MPISQISLANTFSEWLSSTISLISSANQLETGDYAKTSNTLFITSSGVGLSVSNNIIVGGSLTLYGNGTTLLITGDSNFSGNVNLSKKMFSSVSNEPFIEINSSNLVSNLNSQYVGGYSSQHLLLGYSKANLALFTAQSAFAQANTGIDYARSAFAQANAAILAADANATILFISNAYNVANIAAVDAVSAFQAANNSSSYALGAFAQANASLTTGQSAFTQANVALATGQSAFQAANNAGIYALPAFTQANVALVTGQSAFQAANNAGIYALPAFTKANVALATGQSAFVQANIAYNTANSAYNNSNTKFSSSGGIISGNVNITQSLTVQGDLVVSGNVNTVEATSIAVTDNMIYLNADANTALADIGFAGAYDNGTYQHTGFFRDSDDGIWKVFDHYLPEPDASVFINTGHASYKAANMQSDMFIANSLKLLGSSSGSIAFKAASSGSTLNYTLPSADGSSGQALVTNGLGVLSWAAAGANITDTTANATYYPVMSASISGYLTSANTSSSKLTFNPSTGTLSSTILNSSSSISVGGNSVIGSNREYIGFKEKFTSIGNVSGATTLDLSTGHVFTATLTGTTTFTFTNPPPSGVIAYVTIILTQDVSGNRTASFTNAKYTDGVAPTLSTGGGAIDVLSFMTYNGGTSWLGSYVMANVS